MQKKIRNIGIVAHIDAGKTTTSEKILFYAGKIHKPGSVDEGTAELDYLEEEKNRGITIISAFSTFLWKEHEINLIDTPGHVDFSAEVKKALAVVDGVILVLCGTSHVQAQTETLYNLISSLKIPFIVFVNKMDRYTSNFSKALESLIKNFGNKFIPINIPVYNKEDKLIGNQNLITGEFIIYENKEGNKYKIYNQDELKDVIKKGLVEKIYLKESFDKLREFLIEKVADFDDDIAELLLTENDFKTEEGKKILLKKIRTLTINRILIPVYSGSALKNRGIQPLIDGVIDFLPSPDDIEFDIFTTEGEKIKKIDNNLSIAYCFKTSYDKQTGNISFVRVYKNNIEKHSKLYNSSKRKSEKISHLYKVHANKKIEVNELKEGEIGAIIGLKFTSSGDTLLSIKKDIILHDIPSSLPVISMSLEPRFIKDYKNLINALEIIKNEDPSFFYKENPETGYIEIFGMGELHLEIVQHRLKNDFKIETNLRNPVISYRESIEKEVEDYLELKKNEKGVDYFFGCKMKITPKNDNDFIISKEIENDDILISYLKNFSEISFISGPAFGYPVYGVEITIEKIKYNKNEYNDFVINEVLNSLFRKLFLKASPIILEPVMKIEIIVPVPNFSDVYNDLIKKNCTIENVSLLEDNNNYKKIKAYGFLSKFFGYSTTLRTLTSGKGIFNMEFYKYSKKNQ